MIHCTQYTPTFRPLRDVTDAGERSSAAAAPSSADGLLFLFSAFRFFLAELSLLYLAVQYTCQHTSTSEATALWRSTNVLLLSQLER